MTPLRWYLKFASRRDALTLFGLNDDELLPDLHITGAGVMRTGLL